MKRLALLLIRGYQKHLSPLKKPCCRFYPTCSAYSYRAIERFGFFKGGILAFFRILRCNPFYPGGVDHVPEKFAPFKKLPVRTVKTGENLEELLPPSSER